MAERSLSRAPYPPQAVSKVGLAAVVMMYHFKRSNQRIKMHLKDEKATQIIKCIDTFQNSLKVRLCKEWLTQFETN